MRLDASPRRVLAALVLVLGAALAACRSRHERERLTLGIVPLPAAGLVYIAEAKGYPGARGLVVEQRRFSSGRDALAALARGEVDAAVAFETAVVLQASQDPDLEVVTTLHTSRRGTRLVARSDRGIARERDLAGKRVGIPRDSHAEAFLHELLEYAGIPATAVEVVDVAPGAAPDLLQEGKLDAIAIWPPLAERARRQLGPGGSVEIETDVYTELSVLVTRGPVHVRRRGALVKLVRALGDAERLVRDRPADAYAALAAGLPDVPEADLREAWGRARPGLGLSHQLAHVLESEWEWLRAERRVTGEMDLGRALDADVLAEVEPEAVTFVSPPLAKGGR